MHAPIINEHNKGLDDLVDQDELGGDEYAVKEEIDIDCTTIGQAVGPTDKIVSELSKFIGTIARNPRFISLMYTSWHAVPNDTKKRMWEYINSKFLIPVEGKNTLEDMLQKCPDNMPEVQFRQLIEYWKHPTVQAMCEMNSQNMKRQKWRHRMRPINFARVPVALCAAKDNNEEPSKSENFIATRTNTGKEIQADTQVPITELRNRQNYRETNDNAFRAVFGKEKPSPLKCYGSTQAVKGQNLPHSSRSAHDSVLHRYFVFQILC
ncbi:hypothetical protein KY284_026654 [Solanum tuberosum]|nr:hypothetical protein KY284_026654 [Solanum tuberosum]